VRLAPRGDIFAFEEADVTLDGYRAHKPIKAPIAV
jgi:thymidylate synthase